MANDVQVPELGESIRDVRIVRWLKEAGNPVNKDEDLVEIESEKATVMVPAPESGKLSEILVEMGGEAKVGQVIGRIEAGSPTDAPGTTPHKQRRDHDLEKEDTTATRNEQKKDHNPKVQGTHLHEPKAPQGETIAARRPPDTHDDSEARVAAGPDARRALRQFGLTGEEVAAQQATGERVTRQDVQRYMSLRHEGMRPLSDELPKEQVAAPRTTGREEARPEDVIPMTPLRRRIAQRLVAAQHEAALLTTINEVDMSAVTALRKQYGEKFQQTHDVRLGLMGFFVVATVEALKEFPGLNAEVRGTDIVYKKYYDIGVAVGTPRGLVVPVVRGAERTGLAGIEQQIASLARRAREDQLTPADLTGGTFTITNGGVFGSLLSAPIVNPPQTGILALHAIQDRPVAVSGEVLIRPMMYVSLTYDHRVVDGEQAVKFLRRIKDCVEDPARMLLGV